MNLYSEIKAFKKLKRRLWFSITLATLLMIIFVVTDNAWALLPSMILAFRSLRLFEDWQRKYA